MFQVWILQIVLSEILGVPTSVETGRSDAVADFYDATARVDYTGVAYDWPGLVTAKEVHGNCQAVASNKDDDDVDDDEDPYQSCSHVIPEVWHGHHDRIRQGILADEVEMVSGGVLGRDGWFVPAFTAQADPSLLSHYTLQQNRLKLAQTFLRPTTWGDYCKYVSPDNCTTPNNVAQRAPRHNDENNEPARMFVDGLYTGHFRATDENNCTAHPDTCTGHIAAYPCGWSSSVQQIAHHLDMPLASSGPEPGSGGYTYTQMVDIWHAANATKSHVIMNWWTP